MLIDAGSVLTLEQMASGQISSAPFLRAIVSPSPGNAMMYRFAASRDVQGMDDLDRPDGNPGLAARTGGRPVALTGSHQELAFSHINNASTETVMVYTDRMPSEALEGGGGLNLQGAELLPVLLDRNSGLFRLLVKGYNSRGVGASWTHSLSPRAVATVQASLGSALERVEGQRLTLAAPQAGGKVQTTAAVSAALHGTVAHTRTAFHAGYRWQPHRSLNTVNSFNSGVSETYLNAGVRQHVWSGSQRQSVDAMVEGTNLLAEGYQSVLSPHGQTVYLAQMPRALQCGFIFSF